MSARNQSLRAKWLAPLVACVLVACGDAPKVNVGSGSGSDGTVESPPDSGTTPIGTDAGSGSGSGSGDAGSVDSGTCPGAATCPGADAGTADAGSDTDSDAGTNTDADAGSNTGTDAGTGTGMDAGTGTDVDAGSGTGTDAGVSPLSASSGGDKVICAGQSVSIGLPASGGMPPYAYAWSASPVCTGCFDSATVASPTVVPPLTTTFTQTVTDALSQTASADTVVTVLPHPGSAGTDLNLDPGASSVIGPAPVSAATYTWSCNRADCTLSASDVAQPVASPTHTTTYTLDATSGPGCSVRSTLTVQVNLRADTVPRDGELAFPLGSAFLVQFDQPIAQASLTTAAVRLEEALTGNPVATSFSYDAANRRLRVEPTGSNYVAGMDYTLTLAGGPSGITSDDAVQPNLFPSDVQVDFTTAAADTTPPGIAFRNPGVGAPGVASNTTVVVTFTEAVDPATVTDATFTLTGTAGRVTGSVHYDAANWTATFTPSAVLAASTAHTVSLTGIKDLSGNAMTTATSWSFTTSMEPDTTPPSVTAVSPANEATAVASSDPITVTFSEGVDGTSLTGIRLLQVSSGTYVAGTLRYDAVLRVATFTPTVLLGSQTSYEVQVSGVKDLAGNPMVVPFTSSFTTRRTLFADDFESGTGAWNLPAPSTGAVWSLTTANFHSSNHSLTDSAGGKYAAGTVSYAELAAPLNVSGLTSVSVQFWMKARTERNKDFVYVDMSIDGGAWQPIPNAKYAGNQAWAVRTLNLTLSGKSTLRVRFRLESNATKNFDGVYVDDIIVQSP
ncbi:Ig-like domain-containing protein [Archangium lipolyticum]|uniref:Ig-like domain-containing protein n=1 Tax=Archangium lipolyticum TaxID=2970465 RepID=UPI00214A0C74|nr:Ig-like domain-containing protein [Archangium lipolyticum]